jgi:hypothetical protein
MPLENIIRESLKTQKSNLATETKAELTYSKGAFKREQRPARRGFVERSAFNVVK